MIAATARDPRPALPELSLPTLEGAVLETAALRGSRAVLFCFASW